MTKQEIKDLCEDDDKLQWWAMVLFAEIVDALNGGYRDDDQAMAMVARAKAQEFPRLVVQRQLEKVQEGREKLKAERESIK